MGQAKKLMMDLQDRIGCTCKGAEWKVLIIGLGTGVTGGGNENPLLKRHYDNIGYMFITHPHLDHIDDILNFDNNPPTTLRRAKSIANEEGCVISHNSRNIVK